MYTHLIEYYCLLHFLILYCELLHEYDCLIAHFFSPSVRESQ